MSTNKIKEKIGRIFKLGDLVKFVYVTKGKHPQIWNRIEGLGVILAQKKLDDTSCTYTVLSNGETFECIEVYDLEESQAVFNNDEA